MAISTEANGDKRIVTITYEHLKTKVDPTLDDAAKYIYINKKMFQEYDQDGTLIEYDNLTNAQKLGIVDQRVKRAIKDWAKQYHINSSVETSRETATQEAENNYLLEQ